jgi:hypothetical protein
MNNSSAFRRGQIATLLTAPSVASQPHSLSAYAIRDQDNAVQIDINKAVTVILPVGLRVAAALLNRRRLTHPLKRS